MKTFYLVYEEGKGAQSSKIFNTETEARASASWYAQRNPGTIFYTLKAVGATITPLPDYSYKTLED